jgi:type IV pilus modification protein PilV
MGLELINSITIKWVRKNLCRIKEEYQMGKNNKGTTLIELLIALSVLSVGLLGVSKMQLFGIQSNAHANKLTVATILAQDRLEQIKAVIRSGQTVVASDFPLDDYGSIANFSGFRRQVTINNGTDFNTISVTTSWVSSRTRTIAISTIY